MQSFLQIDGREPGDSSATETDAELPRRLRWAPVGFAAVAMLLLAMAAVLLIRPAGALVEPLSTASGLQDVTGLRSSEASGGQGLSLEPPLIFPHVRLESVRGAHGQKKKKKEKKKKNKKKGRLGSFLVVGDWGWDPYVHGWNVNKPNCQNLIAQKMLEKSRELGDVKFIINVGDSFYPNGVSSKTDPQWDLKWRNVYHQELRDVPWYSVYGNHDYIRDSCVCANFTSEKNCQQITDRTDDRNFFYMPDVNFWNEHSELGLEVVGLDMNAFEFGWNHRAPPDQQCALEICRWTSCPELCELHLKERARDGLQLLRDRLKKSSQSNMLVFSHYPTDYFWNSGMTDMLALLRDKSKPDRHIEYFGGHRHSTDNTSTIPTWPNHNWLVGGGGGWSCDSAEQGFVVGEIDANNALRTYSVLVPHWDCCLKPTTTTTTTSIGVEADPYYAVRKLTAKEGTATTPRRLKKTKTCLFPPMDFKA